VIKLIIADSNNAYLNTSLDVKIVLYVSQMVSIQYSLNVGELIGQTDQNAVVVWG